MSNTAVYKRCPQCRGAKQVPGLGGITRDCLRCDGTGKIEDVSPAIMAAPSLVASEPQGEPAVKAQAQTAVASVTAQLDVTPTKLATDKESLPDKDLLGVGVAPLQQPVRQLDSKGREIIFPGYDNDVMEAVLAEPKMTTQQWKETYKNVPGVVQMGLRERASIRELYALSKPAAPRKVDLMASQDKVAAADPEYAKQLKKEQLQAKKQGS